MYQRARRLIHRFVLLPLVRAAFRLQIVGGERLNRRGPAIVVANHNSHVDTAVMMASFPTRHIDRVRPVAAADYFLRGRLLSWFTMRIVGILPLDRGGASDDPLTRPSRALECGQMLILFPEGTRGEPGVLGDIKSGVARLARRCPDVPVIPVWLEGCARAMPKGAHLPRPVPCTATVGRPLFLRPGETNADFLGRLRSAWSDLQPRRREAA